MTIRCLALLICSIGLGVSLHAQYFRVQIIAPADSLPADYFTQKGLKNVWCTVDAGGLYHYYLGSYATRMEAEAARKQLMAIGFPGATVIDLEVQRLLADQNRCAYFKGGPLPLAESDSVRFVYFDSGKATLSEAGKSHALHMLSLLKKEPNSLLYVLGYADAQGSAKANLDLAAERARAVRNFLLDRDIEVERIRLYVYGETEAGAVEDVETVENEFERSQLRQRYRCAVLVWKRQ